MGAGLILANLCVITLFIPILGWSWPWPLKFCRITEAKVPFLTWAKKLVKKVRFYQLFFMLQLMAQPPMDQCVQFFWLWGRCMSKSTPNFTRIRRSMWIQRSKNWYFDGGVAVAASVFSAPPCGPILAKNLILGRLGRYMSRNPLSFTRIWPSVRACSQKNGKALLLIVHSLQNIDLSRGL